MQYLRTGLITKPHGVQGAFKVMPLCDDASRFKTLSDAYIERDGAYTPVKVVRAGVAPDMATIWLEGVETRDEAEALRGAYLCVDRAHAVKLPEGRYFVADLIGCEVFDTEGAGYGRLTDVMETGANDVYVINGEKELLIPALKKLLNTVDVENKRIVLNADVLREVGLFED